MTEQNWALVDLNGDVFNVIVADRAFVEELSVLVTDPDVDTGELPVGIRGYDVTGKTDSDGESIGVNHKRASNGVWSLKPEVVAARKKAADDAAAAKAAATPTP